MFRGNLIKRPSELGNIHKISLHPSLLNTKLHVSRCGKGTI